jgi:glutathione peroxidase-family protein
MGFTLAKAKELKKTFKKYHFTVVGFPCIKFNLYSITGVKVWKMLLII